MSAAELSARLTQAATGANFGPARPRAGRGKAGERVGLSCHEDKTNKPKLCFCTKKEKSSKVCGGAEHPCNGEVAAGLGEA